MKDFDGIIQSAEKNGINAGWSNPCFEIWMFAYFGEMPNIPDSVTCCERFADRFEKVTGHKYQKNDADVYQKLLQYGSFDAAYNLAQKHLELAAFCADKRTLARLSADTRRYERTNMNCLACDGTRTV